MEIFSSGNISQFCSHFPQEEHQKILLIHFVKKVDTIIEYAFKF